MFMNHLTKLTPTAIELNYNNCIVNLPRKKLYYYQEKNNIIKKSDTKQLNPSYAYLLFIEHKKSNHTSTLHKDQLNYPNNSRQTVPYILFICQ